MSLIKQITIEEMRNSKKRKETTDESLKMDRYDWCWSLREIIMKASLFSNPTNDDIHSFVLLSLNMMCLTERISQKAAQMCLFVQAQ